MRGTPSVVSRRTQRNQRGLTLLDLLFAVGLAGLTLALVWPHKHVDRLIRNEKRLAARLAELGAALDAARLAATTDADGDGSGEFPALDRLRATALEGLEPVAGTTTFRTGGWYVTLLLPDRRYLPARTDDGTTEFSTDGAELNCVLVAWPVERGESGMRAYAWTPTDGMVKHTVDGYPYGGPEDPPPLRRPLVERIGTALRPVAVSGGAELRWGRVDGPRVR